MPIRNRAIVGVLAIVVAGSLFALAQSRSASQPARAKYPWLDSGPHVTSLAARFAPPAGFERIAAPSDSFAAWLRGLPLKPAGSRVHEFDGKEKKNQAAHAAVIDIDVGRGDLQQCADFVIRLRAEYLFSIGRSDEVAFHFTSGDLAEFRRWAAGERPMIDKNRVTWRKSQGPDASYPSFRAYLTSVFTYAGTKSLARELKPVASPKEIQIGDVFIRGGSPGHAVIVLDVAENPRTKDRVFLLAQSFMPAQEPHVLKNPTDLRVSVRGIPSSLGKNSSRRNGGFRRANCGDGKGGGGPALV